jgi:hypothetical protein
MLVFTIIGVIATVAKRWIVPMATGAPPEFLDIVTVQARLPDTFSVSSIDSSKWREDGATVHSDLIQ